MTRPGREGDVRRVLDTVLREMTAYGDGWRADWSDFDGRTLRAQLESLEEWATEALDGETESDYTRGTEFRRRREGADDV